MSYQPYDRNPSGIVYFGTAATDQIYESNAGFTIDNNHLRAKNIKIPDGANIGSETTTDAITIAANGKITLAGDLQVNGTTTTISTTNTVVSDLLLELGNGATGSATSDAGIIIERGDDANVFMGFDESENKFIMGSGVFTGASTGGLGLYKMTLVADLEGDVTGNAATATALASARNFSIIGGVMAASDVSFNGSSDVDLTVTAASGLVMNQPTETSIASGDFLVFSDINDSHNLKKITKANLVSGLGGGGMSNFNITDGSTSQQIDDGENITFSDGTGAEFVVSATNTVTVNSVDSEIDHDALSNFEANEHVNHTSVTMTAGNGLTGGGTIASTRTFAVGAGTGITVNADDVQISDGGVDTLQLAADAVDGTKIEDDAVDSEHITDGAVDEVHRNRTVATATSTHTIATDIVTVNGVGTPFTATLPTAASVAGKMVTVKNVGEDAITVAPSGSQTIDGASSYILYHRYETVSVASDGSNWIII